MPTCPTCHQVVSDEENFCTACGSIINQDTSDKGTQDNSEIENYKPSLIFPDQSEIEIDESHRLIGRADLEKFSKLDPLKISRGHFTVYVENGKCFVEDGLTKVQRKPSQEHTFLNNEDITGTLKKELTKNAVLKVSDVEIKVKVN